MLQSIQITVVTGSPVTRPGLTVQTGLGSFTVSATAPGTVSVLPNGDVIAVLQDKIIGAAIAPSVSGPVTIDGKSTVAWLAAAFGAGFDFGTAAHLQALINRSYSRLQSADAVLQDAETLDQLRNLLQKASTAATPSKTPVPLVRAASQFVGA